MQTDKKIPSNRYLLQVAAVSFFVFAVAEVIGALASNSLSLLGDAVTMIVDSMTYGLNMYAEYKKPLVERRHQIKLELYSPLFSVIILIGITGYIIHDAAQTIRGGNEGEAPEDVNDGIMMGFALVNLLFDFGNMFCFYRANRLLGFQRLASGELDALEDELNTKQKTADATTEDVERNEFAITDGNDNSYTSTENSASDATSKVEKVVETKTVELVREAEANMNMCSAYTHVIADTFRSIAVLLAAMVSHLAEGVDSDRTDAFAALVVSAIIFVTTIPLFRGLKDKYYMLRALDRAEAGEEANNAIQKPLLFC